MSKKLQDKVAVITGGASGIGEATALLFADEGACIVVVADIHDEKGKKLVESIGTDRYVYIHCDVTDENQVKSLVETTIQLYRSLDIMFCNAGILNACSQTVLDFDLNSYEKLFAVNVRGVAACMKHAARAMVEGSIKGSIICTASIAASIPTDKHTDYSMLKSAVLQLVRSTSLQLGKSGIRVSPGPIATPLMCNALEVGEEELERNYERFLSLEGALKVKHVANAVLFLASDDSEFITGHNLAVDGGFIRKASK